MVGTVEHVSFRKMIILWLTVAENEYELADSNHFSIDFWDKNGYMPLVLTTATNVNELDPHY